VNRFAIVLTATLVAVLCAVTSAEDLYRNGTIVSHPWDPCYTGNGADFSMAIPPDGNAGSSCTLNGTTQFRLADDFTIPAADALGWRIDSIVVYGYRTGSAAGTAFNGADINVWNGAPNAGGAIVAGGTSSTILTNQYSGINRGFNGTGNCNLSDRLVSAVEVDYSANNLVLLPGTYWVDYHFTCPTGVGFSPHAAGTTGLVRCATNTTAVPGGNALQKTAEPNTWAAANARTAANPVPTEFLFIVRGSRLTGISGDAMASPARVPQGCEVTLSMNPTPSNPNVITSVSGNLSSIGGAANQAFVNQGGGVWSFTHQIQPNGLAPGLYNIPITAQDNGGNQLTRNAEVQVTPRICLAAAVTPTEGFAETMFLITAGVSHATGTNCNAISPIPTTVVRVNLASLGGAPDQLMFDDGTNGDQAVGDNIFSYMHTTPQTQPCAANTLPITAVSPEGHTGNASVQVQTLVPVECVEPFLDENEQTCVPPSDEVNGGCNSTPNVFTDLPACDTRVCGTTWRNGTVRDTDWYRITLPQTMEVTWRVRAEFHVVAGPVSNPATPGVPIMCGQTGLAISPAALANPCELASVTTTLQAGTWYFFVAPQTTVQVPCQRRYFAELLACPTAPEIVVCTGGDLNYDGLTNGLDIPKVVETILGAPFDCSLDFDWDDDLDSSDIALFANAIVAANQYVDVKQRPCQQGQLTCIAFNKMAPAAAKDVIIQAADKDGNTSGCPVNWAVRPILTYDGNGKPTTFGAQTSNGSIPSGQSATVSIAGADEAVVVWCQDTSALQCKISYIPPK